MPKTRSLLYEVQVTVSDVMSETLRGKEVWTDGESSDLKGMDEIIINAANYSSCAPDGFNPGGRYFNYFDRDMRAEPTRLSH